MPNSSQSVILALDIGSSSIRCSAHLRSHDDATKTTLIDDCCVTRQCQTVNPTTGKVNMGGSHSSHSCLLLDEIDAMVDDCLVALRKHMTDPFRIVGLGFSTFVMNLVAVDEYGQVVGEAATLSYACQCPHVSDACRKLKSQLGAEGIKELHQRTGAPIHSAYALPQLRALYANPEHYDLCDRIVIWQTIASLCLSRWRGTPFSHISYSEASWTGLFNFKLCEWDRVALSLLPEECKHSLPPLADYSDTIMPSGGMPEIVGEIEPESNPYWARWPELRGSSHNAEHCNLFLGIGDGACANVGSKCTAPNRIAVTIGTSAAARLCLPLPVSPSPNTDSFVVPNGLFCYRLDRNHVVVGGALTDGGSIVDWARKMLSLTDDAQFQDCLNGAALLYNKDYQSVADGDSTSAPVVAPFLNGERSPHYREGACFALMGLTRDSGPPHFLKSCLEGVILRIESILRLLRDYDETGETPAILVSGAALERNALWRQMLADCTGLVVKLDQSVTEATSRGVARLVSIALAMKGEDANPNSAAYLTEERVSSPRVSHPQLAATEGYWLVAYESQENLIDAISPLWSLD